ncbi:MAG TPA: hypothetical protein DCE42_05010 [Myxococcales bacterium]|nr:hypothetical protein [Myxococcales bacterium]
MQNNTYFDHIEEKSQHSQHNHTDTFFQTYYNSPSPRDVHHPIVQQLIQDMVLVYRNILVMFILLFGALDALCLAAGLSSYFGSTSKGFMYAFQPLLVCLGISIVVWGVCFWIWRQSHKKITTLLKEGTLSEARIEDSKMLRKEQQIEHVISISYGLPQGGQYTSTIEMPSMFHIFEKQESLPVLTHPSYKKDFLTFSAKTPIILGKGKAS